MVLLFAGWDQLLEALSAMRGLFPWHRLLLADCWTGLAWEAQRLFRLHLHRCAVVTQPKDWLHVNSACEQQSPPGAQPAGQAGLAELILNADVEESSCLQRNECLDLQDLAGSGIKQRELRAESQKVFDSGDLLLCGLSWDALLATWLKLM